MEEIVIRIIVEGTRNPKPAKRLRVVTVREAAQRLGCTTSNLYLQSSGQTSKDRRIVRFEHKPATKGRGWAANRPMIRVVLNDQPD
jgi:hypothetical protein